MERNGPAVIIRYSCEGCQHKTEKRFQCQDDSGYDLYCEHSDIGRKHITSYGSTTPDWCPLLSDAKRAAIVELSEAK